MLRSLRVLAGLSLGTVAAALPTFGQAAAAAVAVRFELEVPAGHVGIEVTELTLLRAGSALVNLDRLLSVTGGGTVSLGRTLAEAPDAVEVVYASPLGGLVTRAVVDADAFVLGQRYALPTPSPGGELAAPGAPAEGDAVFSLTTVEVVDPPGGGDVTAPTCNFEETSVGVEGRLRDAGSGLARIDVLAARNLAVDVPAFTPGSAEVSVSARLLRARRSAVLVLRVGDVAGNRAWCKLVRQRRGWRLTSSSEKR